MLRKATIGIALLALLAALMPYAFAQTVVSGEISGTLSDQTGAVIPGGTVTLRSLATGETKNATSGKSGEFHFSLLVPGTYTVDATAKGFSQTEKQVDVDLGQVMNLRIQLGVQSQSQVVDVSEAVSLVQSENANLATTFNKVQLENLPAGGMDMTAFAQTAPGVTLSTGGGYGNFSAFGLPGTSNMFTINGADNMDPYLNLNNSGASNLTLGSNEISEAVVVLNGYTGQYGRQAGAQVNYVTKSGANAFHGDAIWLYNGRDLNANDWFNNATGTNRPFAVSNSWAASFGGPIKRNKAFFFVDNEGLRYVLPGGGPVYIPTPAFSTAVLNNLKVTNAPAVPLYTTALNLYAGAPGASSATPVTDPGLGCGDLAGNLGNFGISQPCAETFRSAVNSLNTEWLMTAKVDYNINNNHHIFVRWYTDHGVQATGTDPINPAFNANSVQPSYSGQLGWTGSFGPRMVNQLVAEANYYAAIFGPSNFAGALSTFPTVFNFTDGAPYTNMGGASFGYGDFDFPQGRKVRQNQLVDDFAIIAGTQTIKFGVNARKNWVDSYAALGGVSGLLVFNSMTDFYTGSLNNGSFYTQNFPVIGAQPVEMYSAGWYGQDEWKLRPNLTWTIAMRFDRNSNISCSNNCFNEFTTPFDTLLHNSNIPYNQSILTSGHAFPNIEPLVMSPRTGFAWGATKSTTIRGGIGIFTDLYQGFIADRFLTNFPAVASLTTQSGIVASGNPNSVFAAVANSAAALQNGFAKGATLAALNNAVPLGFSPPNFNSISAGFNIPKYYEWNFEIQQALSSKVSLSINYVGNKGIDEALVNLYQNGSAPNFVGLPTTSPDARFGEIQELNDQGYSHYNGLVSTLRWRLNSQFSGSFAFTYSRSMDTCSNGCLTQYNYQTSPSLLFQMSPNEHLNYGPSDYDTPKAFNANYVWTPKVPFSNMAARALLGGWTVAGTALFHSGYPFSVIDSGVQAAQGVNNLAGINTSPVLADWITAAPGYPSCSTPNVSCYPNASSQFASASNQNNFGNIPRNAFRGPGYFDTDLNVNRTFAVKERYKLTIGCLFFNVLNHPNFDLPVSDFAAGNFGTIVRTVSPPSSAYGSFQGSAVSGRVIQTQVKFSF